MPQPAASDRQLIPPTEMLHDGSSSEEQFIELGENFLHYILIPRAHLAPTASFLDLGCGNGAVARALTRYLAPEGRYEGVDVNGTTIAWLRERYQPYPRFRFTHANVYNKMYNPNGPLQPAEYRLPFDDSTFDLVLLKSVFTHMLPRDVRAYLKEIDRVLKPGGRSVITYFFLNDESRRFIASGLDAHRLVAEYERDPFCRVSNPAMPEAVVAHDEARIREYYGNLGWNVVELSFGDWCGRSALLGHQDVAIAIKGGSPAGSDRG